MAQPGKVLEQHLKWLVSVEVFANQNHSNSVFALVQELSAREQAQTFVAMSGFPMPFLP